MKRTQIISIGQRLASEWFSSAADRVFIARHTSEINKAFSQCWSPSISEIEKLWIQIKQQYLAIPDDIEGLDRWSIQIIKELREFEENLLEEEDDSPKSNLLGGGISFPIKND